jgi:hypothetical protein
VSRSFFSQSSIFRCTRLKYGSEGCAVEGGGIVGFDGPTLGCVKGVPQPASSPISTTAAISIIPRTGRGKLHSFVSTTLALLLQRTSLGVRPCSSRDPFSLDR